MVLPLVSPVGNDNSYTFVSCPGSHSWWIICRGRSGLFLYPIHEYFHVSTSTILAWPWHCRFAMLKISFVAMFCPLHIVAELFNWQLTYTIMVYFFEVVDMHVRSSTNVP